MPAFEYTALDPHGRKMRGITEADSPKLARQYLRDQQLIPMDLRETRQGVQSKGIKWQRSLPDQQLTLVTRQLATLLQAGLPIEECLAVIGRQSDHLTTSRILLAVRAKVREGYSLADSLRQYPRSFDSLYCATIRAGEQSGHLDGVMLRLADHTESRQQFRQKVQAAMVYPFLLMLMSLLIVAGLMIYVVPDMVQVIIDAGQQLPVLTQALISTSSFLQDWGAALFFSIAAGIAGVNLALRKPSLNLQWPRRSLDLPIFGKWIRDAQAANYLSTLAILTNSGIPLSEAMKIASPVATNRYFSEQLEQCAQRVREGISLNKALEQTQLFSPMMLQLVISGEASGELPDMLEKAAHIQEGEIQRTVTLFVTILEPATLVVMGGFVLTIVLAVMLPILNMNQMVN